MKTLSIKKLGMAAGATAAIFYLGCIILMITVGKEGRCSSSTACCTSWM
ncbi:hypothetical protein [Fodinibius sediminis]|uniref:Uncharacterized protein n=1 Tax=Fodinibius sediminis TaxID=1214077 RepID=A0A521EIB4_9BACT|nr:hypothetical protein [Fodinibius sediminis]SMO83655.1 hypothetical protein SAMN06265218_11672 [Fodinibius sediminis]